MNFSKISRENLQEDSKLRNYLQEAKITAAHRGGTFVGNHDVAPECLKDYGIILQKGGMIIPSLGPEELKTLLVESIRGVISALIERSNNDRSAYLEELGSDKATVVRKTEEWPWKVEKLLLVVDGEEIPIFTIREGMEGSTSWGEVGVTKISKEEILDFQRQRDFYYEVKARIVLPEELHLEFSPYDSKTRRRIELKRGASSLGFFQLDPKGEEDLRDFLQKFLSSKKVMTEKLREIFGKNPSDGSWAERALREGWTESMAANTSALLRGDVPTLHHRTYQEYQSCGHWRGYSARSRTVIELGERVIGSDSEYADGGEEFAHLGKMMSELGIIPTECVACKQGGCKK